VTLAEGICNLILSIILVRPYGIIGDAYGTAIPLACSMICLCRDICAGNWDSSRNLPARSLCSAAPRHRAVDARAFVDAALVYPTHVSATRGAVADRWDRVRTGVALGGVVGPGFASRRTRLKAGAHDSGRCHSRSRRNLSARTISFGTASVVVGCRRRRLVMQKIVRVQRCRNRSEWQWRLAEVEAIGQIIRLRVGIPTVWSISRVRTPLP